MMTNKTYFKKVCLFIFSFYAQIFLVLGQARNNDVDSLEKYSSNDLILKIGNSIDNSLRIIYCESLVKKAKIEMDTSTIILAYDLFAFFNEGTPRIRYLDSVLYFAKTSNDIPRLTEALLEKGTEHYNMRQFRKAMDNYILANNYSIELNIPKLSYKAQHGIGVLKLRIGDHKEALEIHLENLSYFENPASDFSQEDHLITIFSIATSYKRLGNLDLSTQYNKKGIKLALETKNLEMYYLFVLNEGTVHFLRNNIESSLDSIKKALPYFESRNLKPDLAFAYYYLGKIYFQKNKNSLAISYLKKVDTIFQQTNDIHPELASTFKLLSNHYKQTGETENQLNYLSRLIALDSILNAYQSYIDIGIKEKFDIPNLIAERDEIINSLEKKTFTLSYGIVISIFIIIGSYFAFRYRQKKLKTRFEKLLKNEIIKKEKNPNNEHSKKVTSEIPAHIENDILSSLESFEKNNGFKNSKLTLIDLAKSLNTNSNYLSKTINKNKGKNFSSYVNDLRIEFALEELKNSRTFRNFKISAIAEEVGFNNAETFSRLFKNKNGIYPSYFIKQMSKKIN